MGRVEGETSRLRQNERQRTSWGGRLVREEATCGSSRLAGQAGQSAGLPDGGWKSERESCSLRAAGPPPPDGGGRRATPRWLLCLSSEPALP